MPVGLPQPSRGGAIWLDGYVYFVSGATTRKSRDLATNPECALSVSLTDIAPTGLHVNVGSDEFSERERFRLP
jgi:hypothetical protein